jgi:formate/nitrite transporter FocA (FNT family)
LFTKNTVTVILPLLNRKAKTRIRDVARLWGIVLASNLLGAFLFAWLISGSSIFDGDVRAQLSTIGMDKLDHTFSETFMRSILAGWLIALMIWLLPFAEAARVWVISILAYMVGLGGFPHIIAGSIPTFYHVLTGQISFGICVTKFMVPVLLGNVVGGVALVAAAVHAEFLSDAGISNNHPAEKHYVSGHSR